MCKWTEEKKKKRHVHETHVQVHIDIFVRIVQLLASDDMKQKVNSGVLADDGKFKKEKLMIN